MSMFSAVRHYDHSIECKFLSRTWCCRPDSDWLIHGRCQPKCKSIGEE